MPIRFILLVLAPLALGLSACPTKPDPLACQDACSHQDEKTFCDIDGVYPASELQNECIAPPSADACNRVEGCSSLAKPFCTDDSMGVCVECRDGQDCNNGEICDANNTCLVFSCEPGSGGDAACAGVDASQPYCGPGDTCVGCLDSGDCTMATAGVCDETDLQCRSCVTNPECDSKVCGIESGICADPANILYVEKDAVGTQCTLAAPCGLIMTAVGLVSATRNTIVIAAEDYVESVNINAKTVTLVGDGVVNIKPNLVEPEVAFLVSGGSDVRIEGIDIALTTGGGANSIALQCAAGGNSSLSFSEGTISGSAGLGVSASSCDLTVTGSTISGNTGVGVTSSGGSLTVTGSTISGNIGGGINIGDSDFELVNNFIVLNGSNGSAVGGLRITNGVAATQVLDFNTIASNTANVGGADATNLDCGVSTPLVASGNIVYDGVSLGNALPDLDPGINCSLTFSDVKGGALVGGNIDENPMFVNVGIGDYHLQTGSLCINAADPAATLATDIDGEARPQGGRRDMGADEAE